MKRSLFLLLLIAMMTPPLFGKAHKETYTMTCSALWPAVKDTVRNSGFYAIVFLSDADMIASFSMGGGNSFRIESAVLNANGDSCELQVQPLYESPFSNDEGDLKKGVDASVERLKAAKPVTDKNGGSSK